MKKLKRGKDYTKKGRQVVLLFEPTTDQGIRIADDGSVAMEEPVGPQMSPRSGQRRQKTQPLGRHAPVMKRKRRGNPE